jgi:hypothetical protein
VLLKKHKYLFFLILFLLPLNLGKHFIFTWSYVSGLLIDYFVVTLYIQDILIAIMLVLWFLGFTKKDFTDLFQKRETVLSLAFLFASSLSVISSYSIFPSLYAWVRLVLYVGLFLYTLNNFKKEDWKPVLTLIGISVALLGVLAGLQWVKQGSVFDSYLFFGEQPYNFSTFGIVRENILGFTKIPAYGLFRHPKVFGGFLAVVLPWLFLKASKNRFILISFILGVLSLVLTFSYISWGVFILGMLFLKSNKRVILLATLFIMAMSLTLPMVQSSNASIYRRGALLNEGVDLIKQYPLFGVGLNNGLLFAPESRFIQPIHNMFILVLAETGVFSFISFVLLLGYVFHKSFREDLLNVSLLQILLLSSFDHYFFTIHQTQLLFWIVLGIAGSFHYVTLAFSVEKPL